MTTGAIDPAAEEMLHTAEAALRCVFNAGAQHIRRFEENAEYSGQPAVRIWMKDGAPVDILDPIASSNYDTVLFVYVYPDSSALLPRGYTALAMETANYKTVFHGARSDYATDIVRLLSDCALAIHNHSPEETSDETR